ncbi:UTP--glucose-1-phosphate uridylyltransferase (UDP-glucose pyrophosphorylase) (UDPGP) [alpha proteobacterium HTCC2255]|nr:UTP--glucose-1-phosphate uridylyltransferase (UDP-glucose pyrophosphorylase) (UDPGP) [alpha proteobacterium HTCC2255] [Rhodobacterales bacterium HTCC2255]
MNCIKPVYKAVIPVAGLGTRMLPATKAIPKELLPIYDRPIIEHVVKEAIDGGIREIIFVTRSGKEAIENHFDAHYELEHRLVKKGKNKILEDIVKIIPDYVKISSIRQADALGLGHAILCAKHLINDEAFAVLLPDVLIVDRKNRQKNFSFSHLMKAWNKTGIGQVMVERIDFDDTDKYGIVEMSKKNINEFESAPLKALIEKPEPQNAPSNLALLGRYILPPQLFNFLEDINPGVGGEIQLTDALFKLLTKKSLNAVLTDAHIFDCGNKHGFLAANLLVGMQDPKTRTKIYALMNKLNDDDF